LRIDAKGSSNLILSYRVIADRGAETWDRDLANASCANDCFGMDESRIVKRSIRVAGHATSISLEAAFWHGLRDIAMAQQMSINNLVTAIDAQRGGNLSSAIRLFVLDHARNAAPRLAEASAATVL
jgi:predicted DNA-binding ribbon-helix-helix protein